MTLSSVPVPAPVLADSESNGIALQMTPSPVPAPVPTANESNGMLSPMTLSPGPGLDPDHPLR